jgi:hypothetical protein
MKAANGPARKNQTCATAWACTPARFRAFSMEIGTDSMQRKRAIAIAVAQRQERARVLTIAAGLLLLPAALLLLLISP